MYIFVWNCVFGDIYVNLLTVLMMKNNLICEIPFSKPNSILMAIPFSVVFIMIAENSQAC